MPSFALRISRRRVHVATDESPLGTGRVLELIRPFVSARLAPGVRPDCFIDTGAPLNVVTEDLRHLLVATGGTYRPLGTSLFARQGAPLALDWHGVECEIGQTDLVLVDTPSRTYATCRLTGKFALGVHPHLTNTVILGMNFFEENRVRLQLDATGGVGQLSGELVRP